MPVRDGGTNIGTLTANDLQIVLQVPRQPALVAGVPGILRAAHDLVARENVGQVVFYTESRDFVVTWCKCLMTLPWREVGAQNDASRPSDHLIANSPVLVLAPDGIPDVPSLYEFVHQSGERGKPTAWAWNGTVVAAYFPAASGLCNEMSRSGHVFPYETLDDPTADRLPASPGAWESLRTMDGIRRAEDRLFRSLRRESDGYLARLDRTVSIALSRLLIRTPVTPNGITALSLVVGLVGAALLASPGYWVALPGAALLLACCVLDGCDGELARLKLRSTPFGARFDVIADNIVHLAIFVAIPLHLSRVHGGARIWTPAIALMAGVLLSAFSVWWLILRQPEERRMRRQRIYERIASRDFIYLVFFLTAIQHLEWFVWSAAIGANVFWVILWLIP
jgi:phosphatidylglycerophosphate synthase